jgi:fermentation-respiration switch protein FrsA (DUF1100 family)
MTSDFVIVQRRSLNVRRRLVRTLTIMVFLTLPAACGIENRMIFQPAASLEKSPADVGLEFEEIFFSTRDNVRLHGWFVPHRDAKSTLVWFHGNAGNISHRVDNLKLLHERVKVNVFIFDYRGYGRSEGRPSEEGTYLDGEAALEAIAKKIGDDSRQKMILFGRSLGAAIAAEMATRVASQALILESPFISIPEMARVIFPFIPIAPFLRTQYDVRQKIKKIKVPLLVLHGDRDEIVPFEHGKIVFDAAPEPKTFFTIAGAAHNDTYVIGGEIYFRQLKQFIDESALAAN